MSAGKVVKWKWTTVWNFEKEEAWLRERAREGLHLDHASPWGRYVFRRGAPADVVYRLDYARDAQGDRAYVQLFEDAGWELALSCMGWQYWRKAASAGAEPQIFTDRASRAAMLERVRRLVLFIAFPNVVVAAQNLFLQDHSHGSFVMGFFEGIQIALVPLLALGLWSVTRKLQALRFQL
jgi:hypothetical protein